MTAFYNQSFFYWNHCFFFCFQSEKNVLLLSLNYFSYAGLQSNDPHKLVLGRFPGAGDMKVLRHPEMCETPNITLADHPQMTNVEILHTLICTLVSSAKEIEQRPARGLLH